MTDTKTPKSTSRLRSVAGLGLALTMLAACAGNQSERDELAFVERPVEVLYNEATRAIDRNFFSEAIPLFEAVERQHPYSEWARRSMLMAAYSAYRAAKYDDAIERCRRYIGLHPGTRGATYAYYLIALSYFERIVDVGRDQKVSESALAALQDVVRRAAGTPYAKDAALKIDMVNDQLAGKEMEIGRFYLNSREHIAAIGRFTTVVKNYQTTSHAPEALYRLAEAYLSLGLADQAQVAASVLGYNHPRSIWYARAYELMTVSGLTFEQPPEKDPDGWFDRMRKKLF